MVVYARKRQIDGYLWFYTKMSNLHQSSHPNIYNIRPVNTKNILQKSTIWASLNINSQLVFEKGENQFQ